MKGMSMNLDDDDMPIDLLLNDDPEMRDMLGRRFREIRESKKITLTEVAKAIGMSHPQLSNIERGRARTKWDTLRRLALYHGLSIKQLTDEYRKSPPKQIAPTGLTPWEHEILNQCRGMDVSEQQKVEQFILELIQQRFDNARG